jgi:hypothetical protein
VVTIAGLSQLAPPKPLGPKTPRHGWEFNQVEINPALRSFKLEDDQDIHLVVHDAAVPLAHHMIVEFPNPRCPPVTKFPRSMKNARDAPIRACGQPPRHFITLRGEAKIHG